MCCPCDSCDCSVVQTATYFLSLGFGLVIGWLAKGALTKAPTPPKEDRHDDERDW